MRSNVAAFVARHWSVPLDSFTVTTRPLRGGLQSSVFRATITSAAHDKALPRCIVVKELRGPTRRESQIYSWMWNDMEQPPTARVLGVDSADDTDLVYLEDLGRAFPWPWADTGHASAVCRELARLHDTPGQPGSIFHWDYERELHRSAEETLAAAGFARDEHGVRYWRRTGDLRRIVNALPVLRERLREGGATLIHGDVHPGNVILRTAGAGYRVSFIDWGRARVGSPLEDVASWLHSLGCWEPQARKRHDTLLRAYLESRRTPQHLDADVRRQYWFASASNALAGAVRYHLAVLTDPASSAQLRGNARIALTAWERVVRRAAALLTASRDD